MAIRNEQIVVTNEEAGKRLDQILAQRFPQVSRAYLQKRIEEQSILLNGKAARKGDLPRANDRIDIREILEVREREPAANAALSIQVVYEDADLAVIEKPAGIPTHPVKHEETNTVVNWWIARNQDIAGFALLFEEPLRAGIVHRLDTQTSGLMIVARTAQALSAMQAQFRAREVKKTYLAIVVGNPPEKGSIDWPIAHDPKNKRRMMAVRKAKDIERYRAKSARTEFTREQQLPGYALLRVRTLTGRMHQVRVHFAALGFPLLGDPVYSRASDRARPPFECTRHYLHATSLSFRHPTSGEAMRFESELPTDFSEAIRLLSAKNS